MKILVTKVLPASQKGDLAIALSLLSALRARFPDAEISLLCRRPAEDGHYFQTADNILPELFPTETARSPLHRFLRLMRILTGLGQDDAMAQFDQRCRSANVLVFCGGGSLGGYGFGNLVLHALCPLLMARRAGLPIFFSAISVHDYKNRLHRLVHSAVLKKADCITVRDRRSLAVLDTLDVTGDYSLTADWAWLLPAVERKEAKALLASEGVPSSGEMQIGINLRSIQAVDPERRTNRGGFDYTKAMAEVISSLVTRIGADVVIFSMNRPPASDDLAFAQQVVSVLNHPVRNKVHLLKGDYNPGQIKGMIARLSLFIGTRLHPTLFALSSMVPTLTVHDQEKVAGLMELAGLEEWHTTVRGLEPARLVDRVIELQENRTGIIEKLNVQAPRLRAATHDNLNYIAKCTNRNLKTVA